MVDSGMNHKEHKPRRANVVDRVALAEAQYKFRNTGVFAWRLEKFGSIRKAREEVQLQRERDALQSRYLHPRRSFTALKHALTALAVLLYVGMMAIISLAKLNFFITVPAFVVLMVFVFLLHARPDARLKAFSLLRTRPVRKLVSAEASRHAALASDAQCTLAARASYRDSLGQNSFARAQDISIPGSQAYYLFHACVFACVFLIASPSVMPSFTSISRFAFVLPIVYALITLRRTTSNSIDRLRKEHKCPNCKFDCSTLPPHPLVHSLSIDAGTPLCPECGMHWPLVPPPTPEEVLSAP
jgi:hypothetical protein